MFSAPPWIWYVSGGSPLVIRVASTALALDPAPPGDDRILDRDAWVLLREHILDRLEAVRLAARGPVGEELHLAAAR